MRVRGPCGTHIPALGTLRCMLALTAERQSKSSVPTHPFLCSSQAGCGATRLSGDGQTMSGDAALQEPPSYPPIQVIQARVSSGSSSEVSSINSDLEVQGLPGGRVRGCVIYQPLLGLLQIDMPSNPAFLTSKLLITNEALHGSHGLWRSFSNWDGLLHGWAGQGNTECWGPFLLDAYPGPSYRGKKSKGNPLKASMV